MIKKLSISMSALVIASTMFSVSAFASQTRTYTEGRLPMKSTYTGFSVTQTLPTLSPVWTSGTENKINSEFWFPINNNENYWVEMGYHTGYAFNSDGSPNTSASYNGLFTAMENSNGWSLNTFAGKSWSAGQSHTWGNSLYQGYDTASILTWFSDMIADGTTVITYKTLNPGVGTIDAGLEWGISNTATQSATNSTMTNLKFYDSGTWKTWATAIGTSTLELGNTHTGYTAAFNKTSNQLTLNKN
jgi:hypothetical protein